MSSISFRSSTLMVLGEGDLGDEDLFKEDLAQRILAGLKEVSDSRRLLEYLFRFDRAFLEALFR